MRTLLPALLEEQRKVINSPAANIEIQGASPRIAFDYNQFDKLYWESAYSDSTNISYHGVTMPADGSLVRVRCETGAASLKLYTQRVASPTTSSTFTSWTERSITGAGNIFPRPIAITSYGTEVFIFWLGYYDSPLDWCLAYIKSTNSGASFGSLVYQKIYDHSTGNSLPKSIAACHNGNTAFVVYSYTNEAGAWNWGYGVEAASDFTLGYGYTDTVSGLSCYYGNDYNVVGLVTDSDGNSRLAMNIRGVGGDVVADTWYGWNYLDLSVAGVKKASVMSQYIQSIPSLVNQSGAPFGDAYYKQLEIALKFIQGLPYNPMSGIPIPPAPTPDREIPAYRSEWLTTTFVQELSAALNIGFNSPFICEPKTGHSPILSVTKENTAWFYRLKPSTDFIDAQWTEAFTLPLLGVTYGCAITTDGSDYMWLSRPNQVWRARIPGYLEEPIITSEVGIIDYHNDTTAVTTGWRTVTTACSGTEFKPSYDYSVQYILIKLYRVGDPGTLTLRFDNNFAGTENPTAMQYSATIDGDNVTADTDGDWYQFDLGESVAVDSDNSMFIGLQALSGDGSNYIRWQYATPITPIPQAYGVGAQASWDGSQWVDIIGSGTFLLEISSSYRLDTDTLLSFETDIKHHAQGTLKLVLDNTDGTYDSLGAGDVTAIQKGTEVIPKCGYTIGGTDNLAQINGFFVDRWEYGREASKKLFILHCIDAWGLMENVKLPSPVEFNLHSDEYTTYEVIEFLLKLIGATITYDSRSTYMSAGYPMLDFPAGMIVGNAVRKALSLCSDLLRFRGLVGYISNPQTTDISTYEYDFP